MPRQLTGTSWMECRCLAKQWSTPAFVNQSVLCVIHVSSKGILRRQMLASRQRLENVQKGKGMYEAERATATTRMAAEGRLQGQNAAYDVPTEASRAP